MKLTPKDFNRLQEYPVLWGDMDSAQHVNNLVYLRWAETTRVTFFESIGVDVRFGPGGIGGILAWQDCKYTFPLTYPDTAVVGARLHELHEDQFVMETAIFSKRHGRLAALTKQTIVPYDYGTLSKAPLPVEWKEGLLRMR